MQSAHSPHAVLATSKDPGAHQRGRALVELCVGYGLILATIWTPRPAQHWLYWISVAWIVITAWLAFPGWAAMGFRRGGFLSSLWVVFASLFLAAIAVAAATRLHTLRHPIDPRGWLLTFGGYAVWSFAQQFMLQGYFLFRLLHILERRESSALAAAGMFAAAHLPNPVLTPMTLVWGACACFVFLRFRNVYPLAMAHAILGITIVIAVPGPVVHNMRVGLGYVRYHPPHRPATPLPQAVP